MKIGKDLQAILNGRSNSLVLVIIKGLSFECDRERLKELGMRASKIEGERTFVGHLRSSDIKILQQFFDDRIKIDIERAVPRSRH